MGLMLDYILLGWQKYFKMHLKVLSQQGNYNVLVGLNPFPQSSNSLRGLRRFC